MRNSISERILKVDLSDINKRVLNYFLQVERDENSILEFQSYTSDGDAKDQSKLDAIAEDIGFDESVFTKEELISIDVVIDQFKNISPWDLVDLSHREKAWVDLESQRGVIGYQNYAFDIVGV